MAKAKEKKNRTVAIVNRKAKFEYQFLSELEAVQIPGYGQAESLNAGVATGIFLSAIRRG